MKESVAKFLLIPSMFGVTLAPLTYTSVDANTSVACEDERDANAVLVDQLYRSRFITERDAAGLIARFAKDKKALELKVKELEEKLKTLKSTNKESTGKK